MKERGNRNTFAQLLEMLSSLPAIVEDSSWRSLKDLGASTIWAPAIPLVGICLNKKDKSGVYYKENTCTKCLFQTQAFCRKEHGTSLNTRTLMVD